MRDFDGLIDDFMAEWFEEHPAAATFLGVEGYDDRLGEFSADAFGRRERQAAAWIERLDGFSGELSVDQEIDRDLVVSILRGNLIVSDWQVWRRNPDAYLGPCLNGVFGLFLHRLYPEAELARLAAARLRQVDSVLAAGRANLAAELAAPVFVQRAIGQCRAGIAYARDMVPAEISDPSARADLAEAGAGAAAAFESFLSFLEDLESSAGGEYALGEERYSRLLEEKEQLGYGVFELRKRGQAAYDDLDAEMRALAKAVGGRDDWRSVVEEMNQDHPSSPEEMRLEYEEWTARARAFLAAHDLVTFPEGERCEVVPSPPFQRPVLAVASYFRPPAFRPSLTGRFNVPFPPEGVSEEEIQKRLQTNSRSSIPTIAVHEAYPGHHWHLTMSQANPRPVRKVLSSAYFAEGWGLYSERMMREEGFFADPRHELGHLDARIFRAARIVVDTSLHVGDMSFEEAVTFMTTKAGLSEPTARAEVGRYCTWPTQASSYLTGSLEIERMRSAWLDGGGSLKAFHDKIAGTGVLPIALAERALFAS
ncbi:MAG: DUF885 domain-containing protein [Actinomycetota bacterium]